MTDWWGIVTDASDYPECRCLMMEARFEGVIYGRVAYMPKRHLDDHPELFGVWVEGVVTMLEAAAGVVR